LSLNETILIIGENTLFKDEVYLKLQIAAFKIYSKGDNKNQSSCEKKIIYNISDIVLDIEEYKEL
jgi:hypothetical protein